MWKPLDSMIYFVDGKHSIVLKCMEAYIHVAAVWIKLLLNGMSHIYISNLDLKAIFACEFVVNKNFSEVIFIHAISSVKK